MFSVEFFKEECRDPDASPFGPFRIRLLSPASNKYICFNKNGRVKAVVSQTEPSKAELQHI